jgi:hypothetical protein
MHNDATLERPAPPIATVRSASTAIYNPPSDGFPFVAVVFSPDGAIQAFRAFPSRRDAEAFLQGGRGRIRPQLISKEISYD